MNWGKQLENKDDEMEKKDEVMVWLRQKKKNRTKKEQKPKEKKIERMNKRV